MSEQLESLGAMTTAGLAAATIEGVAGAKHGHGEAHGNCANCKAPLSGPYCAQCGQVAHIHRSLLHLVEEVLHGVFHLDTKSWRTIPLLIFAPGRLTRNYIDGQRMRYVSPLALFLFMIFLSFFAASFTNTAPQEKVLSPAALQAQIADDNKDLDAAKTAVEKATSELSNASKNGGDVNQAKENLSDAQQEMQAADKTVKDAIALAATAAKAASTAVTPSSGVKSDAQPIGKDVTPPAENEGTHSENPVIDKAVSTMRGKRVDTSWPAFDRMIKHTFANPDLALYKLKNTAYKYSFMLVPISLPFMWLLFFWKRGVKMFDHAVFVLYSLCFMSLLFISVVLLSLAGVSPALAGFATFIPPIHIFVQLRGTYGLSIFSALWRTTALVVVTFIVLVLFFMFALMMSAH